ncbi:MAG: hypothetical protein ACK58L_03205 [Planctomycetota bacterium]
MMSAPSPIYTRENTTCAFQLIYSVAVFWKERCPGDLWLPELQAQCEASQLRILQHRFSTTTCSLFLVSARPNVAATEVVRGVKGRLQALVRASRPNAFQRNYDIHSIGSTSREKTEHYVAGQLQHHAIDQGQIRSCRLDDLQFINPDVVLSRVQFTGHGRYRCNLHLCVRFMDQGVSLSSTSLERVRAMTKLTATRHQLLLSRLGLLTDHLHLVVGIPATRDPASVTLSFMNNIAWEFGMQPVLWRSCYVGTIGEYDLGAIKDP